MDPNPRQLNYFERFVHLIFLRPLTRPSRALWRRRKVLIKLGNCFSSYPSQNRSLDGNPFPSVVICEKFLLPPRFLPRHPPLACPPSPKSQPRQVPPRMGVFLGLLLTFFISLDIPMSYSIWASSSCPNGWPHIQRPRYDCLRLSNHVLHKNHIIQTAGHDFDFPNSSCLSDRLCLAQHNHLVRLVMSFTAIASSAWLCMLFTAYSLPRGWPIFQIPQRLSTRPCLTQPDHVAQVAGQIFSCSVVCIRQVTPCTAQLHCTSGRADQQLLWTTFPRSFICQVCRCRFVYFAPDSSAPAEPAAASTQLSFETQQTSLNSLE